jgi:hypothetical protein
MTRFRVLLLSNGGKPKMRLCQTHFKTTKNKRAHMTNLHQILLSTLKLLDLPHNAVHFRCISKKTQRKDKNKQTLTKKMTELDSSNSGLELWSVNVGWNRNKNLNVVGSGARIELSTSLKNKRASAFKIQKKKKKKKKKKPEKLTLTVISSLDPANS